MKDIPEYYKKAVVQVATPFSVGMGFILRDHGLIVTTEQVVRGNREVMINGIACGRSMASVLLTDPLYDIAFLSFEVTGDVPPVRLDNKEIEPGDTLWLQGYSAGDRSHVAEGRVIEVEEDRKFVRYQSRLDPLFCGCPVFGAGGELSGINTVVYPDGKEGLFLPAQYLQEVLDAYVQRDEGKFATRCMSCYRYVYENTLQKKTCPNCFSEVMLPSDEDVYESFGISRTIEDILEQCGHDVRLARRGLNMWEVDQGSALISVSYYEPAGLITGDAVLCRLPEGDALPVYEFLLRQNHEIEGLTLSIKDRDVVLSLIIYDRYLNTATGIELFNRLFRTADDIDNVLVERYGCAWI